MLLYSNGKFAYVVTKYDNTFGRCFSIRIADFITADGLLNVELVGRQVNCNCVTNVNTALSKMCCVFLSKPILKMS